MGRVRPFLKWAGGKGQLVDELERRLPIELLNGQIERYIEPFVGGGALFFMVAGKYDLDEYIINDNNSTLMGAYETLREKPYSLIEALLELQEEYFPLDKRDRTKFYYDKRTLFNSLRRNSKTSDSLEVAALFVFLNKTCYNGLFRLSRVGDFNVPIGAPTSAKLFDKANLLRASETLQRATIFREDYKQFLSRFRSKSSRDLIYVDPPYVVNHGDNGFSKYNEKIFSWEDQVRLSHICSQMITEGALLMVSNARHPDISTLYPYPPFWSHVIQRSSVIGGANAARKQISEYLFTSFQTDGKRLFGEAG